MSQILLVIWLLAAGCASGVSIWILYQSLKDLRDMREQENTKKPN